MHCDVSLQPTVHNIYAICAFSEQASDKTRPGWQYFQKTNRPLFVASGYPMFFPGFIRAGFQGFIQVKCSTESEKLIQWNASRYRITARPRRGVQKRWLGGWWSRWSRQRSEGGRSGSQSGCCCPFLVRELSSATSWWSKIFCTSSGCHCKLEMQM